MAKYRFDQIAINSTEKKKPVEEDRFTYLGLEHLDSGTLKVTRFGSEVAPIGEKLVMHKGDVLFGKRRAYQKKVAIAPFDGIFSAHGMVLRPKEDVIDKDFFPLFISSDYFLDAAIKISVGSLSPTINWRDLKELEFELPDMDTQRKLAEVLWSINDTMEAYKRLISATDELVKSQFMEQFGDPRANPKQLPVKPLGEVCMVERGGSPRPIADYVTDSEDGINWIKIGDADGTRYISETAEKIIPEGVKKSRMVQAGDLILSNSMSFGHPYILKIDGCIHDGWLVLHFDKAVFDALYLQTYLGLPVVYAIFETMAAGGVVNNLNSEIVKRLPVIVPAIDQQEQFAAFVRQSDKSKYNASQAMRL
nr:MAG TPA: hypothetical protein [Caudoviricetes sp.]